MASGNYIGHRNYRAQSADIPHMGPSAQDFRAAFALGRGDTTISTVDADGVALAAIQGLNAKLEDALEAKNRQLGEQASALAEQQRQVAALSARLREFEVIAADVAAMKAALAETRRDREGIAAK